ncbi:hypothetical protein [Ketobacter sp.]|uniref:hypothetical protein n=1 Tax=Ketobacter sp. TaxID=2083498 RepID=UPI000F251C1D|nr:hypothetical protein [Ketobacter sp.]RLU00176.1 MAG: hypothetical protein D9N14_06705 [Ketobacter sp.]
MFQLLKTTVLASACALAAASALAADAKNYPGSMGVKYSGATPSYSSSAIVNPSSSSWMYVDLPAINDEDNDILISYVRVLDRHYSSDVRCSINQAYWNNSADTMYGWWGTNVYSTGSSSNSQTLSTGPLGGTGMNVHTYFSCAVPPTYSGNQSRIISYYVYEG